MFTSEVEVGDQLVTTDGVLVGTVASIISTTSLTLSANAAVAVTAGSTLRRVRAPKTSASVNTGASANTATDEIWYFNSANNSAHIRTKAESKAGTGVTLTPILQHAIAAGTKIDITGYGLLAKDAISPEIFTTLKNIRPTTSR